MNFNLFKRSISFVALSRFVEVKLLKERDFFYDKSRNKCFNFIHIGPCESHADGVRAYNVILGRLSVSFAKLGQPKVKKPIDNPGEDLIVIEHGK